MSAPLLLVLDEPTRRHLARAVADHLRWCRVNAIPPPPLLRQLTVVLAASDGQGRPPDAEPLPAGDSGPVALTYDDTAVALSVSARTVRRLVSSGELPVVNLGGCRRITRRAIEKYLSDKEQANGTDHTDDAA